MIQQLPFEFAAVEHSCFRRTGWVTNDDVLDLAATELTDRIEVGHHVEVIERENHHCDADAVRVGDVKEVRGMKRLYQLSVQVRSRINERNQRGGYLSQDRNEFVEVVRLTVQWNKLGLT